VPINALATSGVVYKFLESRIVRRIGYYHFFSFFMSKNNIWQEEKRIIFIATGLFAQKLKNL